MTFTLENSKANIMLKKKKNRTTRSKRKLLWAINHTLPTTSCNDARAQSLITALPHNPTSDLLTAVATCALPSTQTFTISVNILEAPTVDKLCMFQHCRLSAGITSSFHCSPKTLPLSSPSLPPSLHHHHSPPFRSIHLRVMFQTNLRPENWR